MTNVVASAETYNHEGFKGITSDAQSFVATLKFTFNIRSVLKGTITRGSNVTAVVKSLWVFDDRTEAQETADRMLSQRDTQWDSREAAIFLVKKSATVPITEASDVYFMSGWDIYEPEAGDQYSIASKRNKIWLPEAQSATSDGRSANTERRFLTDVPTTQTSGGSGQTTHESPTITHSDLAAKITSVTNAMNAQPDRRHRMCVAFQYFWTRVVNHWRSEGLGSPLAEAVVEPKTESGLPANTNLSKGTTTYFVNENWQSNKWLEGDHDDLFTIGDVKFKMSDPFTMPNSFSAGGGRLLIDGERRDKHIKTTRPLPAGEYTFIVKSRGIFSDPCEGHTERVLYVVTVTAPAGTLHEAFFDPVTDGSAIAADPTKGVLKPASFTDTNNASATLQRISYDSNTVKLTLTPHTGLANQVLDFIALDGKVSLSLHANEATVDAPNNTLSWPVSHQTWKDGDKLMLRIRVRTL